MSRVKSLLVVSVVVFAAIGFAAVFPQECQRVLFNTIFALNKWKHEYYLKDNINISAEALAFEDMFRAAPLSHDVPTLRKALDSYGMLGTVPPSTTTITAVTIGSGLKCYWITPAGIDEQTAPVVVYLHGGGYVSGSFQSSRGFLVDVTHRLGARGLFVEYSLAPEKTLPTQTDEVVLVYRWLLNTQKVTPKRIALLGDSAGGGLVLLSLLALNHEDRGNFMPPAAAVLLSPWTDLVTTPEGRPSYAKNKDREALLTKEWLQLMASHATGTKPEDYEKRKSPKFSPMYASYEGVKFPPLLMQVGEAEILRDDTMHLVGKLQRQAGIDVTVEELPSMQHNAAMFHAFLPESEQALTSIIKFLETHTKK